MAADHLSKMVAAAMWEKDEAAKMRGLVRGNVNAGKAEFSLNITLPMINALGLCAGGEVFALAETAFLYAANSRNRRAVSQSATIQHFAPALADDTLRASASEISRSGHTGVYMVSVHNQRGVLIAQLQGQARIVKGEWIQSFSP